MAWVPEGLSPTAARWWLKVHRTWRLEAHQQPLLDQAAGCLDRIAAAKAVVDAQGITTADRFGQLHPHPGIAIERDNKVLFARLVRELALTDDPGERRPPALTGRYEGRR